ncbi:hypothetical protein VCHC28A1_3700, partial [Vibrio cholerae HC-28A1]
MLGGGAKQA